MLLLLQFPEVFWDDVDYFGITQPGGPEGRGRCFMYWNLARFNGGVPLLTSLVSGISARAAEEASVEEQQEHMLQVSAALPKELSCTCSELFRRMRILVCSIPAASSTFHTQCLPLLGMHPDTPTLLAEAPQHLPLPHVFVTGSLPSCWPACRPLSPLLASFSHCVMCMVTRCLSRLPAMSPNGPLTSTAEVATAMWLWAALGRSTTAWHCLWHAACCLQGSTPARNTRIQLEVKRAHTAATGTASSHLCTVVHWLLVACLRQLSVLNKSDGCIAISVRVASACCGI